MASISTDANGNKTLQFAMPGGGRKTIRLGKVPKRVAESVKIRVEHLIAMKSNRLPMDAETAQWVDGVSDALAGRLAAVGLVPPRQADTLGPFLDAYVARRKLTAKRSTMKNLRQVQADLIAAFGPDQPLRTITADAAERFRDGYLRLVAGGDLASATAGRRLRNARMFFKAAKNVIPANPFEGLSIATVLPKGRQHYVSVADGLALIAAARNVNWRLIVALARFGGVRCPSELLPMEWAQVDFARGRMTVFSPKTEHHPGRESRETPLFPHLLRVLREARAAAPAGERFVIGGEQGDRYRRAADGPNGWQNANLRTTFLKLVKRAGLAPWPKIFQNLRASLETDLMQSFPIHVVTAWIGNTPAVALKHYLQVRDDDFRSALQFALHDAAGPGMTGYDGVGSADAKPLGRGKTAGKQGKAGGVQMPRQGLEPGAENTLEPSLLPFPAATGAAKSAATHPPDPELTRLAAGWPALPANVRAAVLALAGPYLQPATRAA